MRNTCKRVYLHTVLCSDSFGIRHGGNGLVNSLHSGVFGIYRHSGCGIPCADVYSAHRGIDAFCTAAAFHIKQVPKSHHINSGYACYILSPYSDISCGSECRTVLLRTYKHKQRIFMALGKLKRKNKTASCRLVICVTRIFMHRFSILLFVARQNYLAFINGLVTDYLRNVGKINSAAERIFNAYYLGGDGCIDV